MTDTIPPMTPMRPFLLKGVLEWILNNDMTPHIIVDATMPRVEVPPQSIKDDQVVLNISPSAVSEWEVNDDFIAQLEEKGLVFSGMSPDRVLVEMIEIKDHPWFVATQAHPEFKSRPNKPHPLFQSFVKAALATKK